MHTLVPLNERKPISGTNLAIIFQKGPCSSKLKIFIPASYSNYDEIHVDSRLSARQLTNMRTFDQNANVLCLLKSCFKSCKNAEGSLRQVTNFCEDRRGICKIKVSPQIRQCRPTNMGENMILIVCNSSAKENLQRTVSRPEMRNISWRKQLLPIEVSYLDILISWSNTMSWRKYDINEILWYSAASGPSLGSEEYF